jgi:hypothetical protein
VGSLKPGLFPEDQATSLTAAVSGAIASECIQMDGVLHTASAGAVDCVAGLMCSLVNLELLSAILKHFWHEWKFV